jgi:hypothetical protein
VTRELPPSTQLIAEVKTGGPTALDKYAPEIDQLTDTEGAGQFLGIKDRSVRRSLGRIRADGTPEFAPPDQRFRRSPAWTYRTLVLHRAASPGPGGTTRFQPGESGRLRKKTSAHD